MQDSAIGGIELFSETFLAFSVVCRRLFVELQSQFCNSEEIGDIY